MPSNQFGTEPAATGGTANLSNYYTKPQVDAIAVGKCTKTSGVLDTSEIPALALTSVSTVADDTARDALTVQQGDVAYVTSTGLTYMWSGSAWITIDSTSVSWDNTKSSSNQSATTKFGLIDTALASALTPSGSTGDYKVPMYLSSTTSWHSWPRLSNTGGDGESIICFDGGAHEGGQIGALRNTSQYGSSASSYAGRYMVKKFQGQDVVSVTTEAQTSNESQKIRIKMTGTASDDGQYLKWDNGSGTASWQAVSSGSGPSLPSISSSQANEILRVNGSGNDLETFALTLVDAGSTSGQVSLKGTTHSKSIHSVKTLKAGSNVTLSTSSDPNCIEISSSGGGGGSGPTIDDTTTSTTKVWSSDKISQEVAAKAALSHTHAISEVTGLQSALDAKVDDTQLKTSHSTSASDVYSCSYINDSTNVFGSGSVTNQLLQWNGSAWGAGSIGGSGTYLKSTGSGLTYTNFINDSGNGASDQCYSSSKVYSDLQGKASTSHNHDGVYLKISDKVASASTSADQVYNAPYLNTQLDSRLSSTITNGQASGAKIWSTTGNALTLKPIVGGTNMTVTENATNITLSSTGGGGGSSDGVVTGGSVSGSTLTLTRTGGLGNVTITGLPSGADGNDYVTGGSVSGTTLTLTRSGGLGDVTITGLPSGADGALSSLSLSSAGVLTATVTAGGSTSAIAAVTFDTDKLAWKVYQATSNLPTASSHHGMVAHVHGEGAMYYAHNGSWHKLANHSSVPAAQVQSDWNATSGLGEVLNKPTIPAAQVQSDWNATSGLGEILNKPTIPNNESRIVALETKATDITYGSTTTSVANTLAPTVINIQNQPMSGLTAPTAANGDIWAIAMGAGGKGYHVKAALEVHDLFMCKYHRAEFGDVTIATSLAQQHQTHFNSNYQNSANSIPFHTSFNKAGRNGAIVLNVNQSSNNDATDRFQYEVKSADLGTIIKMGKQVASDPLVTVPGELKLQNMVFGDSQQHYIDFNNVNSATNVRIQNQDYDNNNAYLRILRRKAGTLTESCSFGAAGGANVYEFNVRGALLVEGVTKLTGAVTSDETTFTLSNQLVSKSYVDTTVAAASGGPTWTDHNVSSLTNVSTIGYGNKNGALWGNRGKSLWWVTDRMFEISYASNFADARVINGSRQALSMIDGVTSDGYFPYRIVYGGHLTMQPQEKHRYNFSRFYTTFGSGTTSPQNLTAKFRVSATNDGCAWDTLSEFTMNSMTYDSTRTGSNHGINGQGQYMGYATLYSDWPTASTVNANYYHMFRITLIDHGNAPAVNSMDASSYYKVINVNYFLAEIEWG